MTSKKGISVVIPTLEEEQNIKPLTGRLAKVFQEHQLSYELIFIDDHSDDKTVQKIEKLASDYPVSIRLKQGKTGKAYSLVEGFEYAQYDVLVMIDADLQYPPEAIPGMVKKIYAGADVVVANRAEHQEGFIRRIASKVFLLFFARLLHGFTLDVQTGLKAFRRELLSQLSLNPKSPWTFDLEFLVKAREAGCVIDSVDISFADRLRGHSKISLIRSSVEIAYRAVLLKLRKPDPAPIHPEKSNAMQGAGVAYRRRRFVTHTTLPHHVSALKTLAGWQKLFGVLLLLALGIGLYLNALTTAIIFIGALSVIYFIDVLFNLYLVIRSLSQPPEITFEDRAFNELDETKLPVYTILCPLYKEAKVLPSFLEAIDKISWPKDKLDVILLLEEDDKETIAKAESLALPGYVRAEVVPHSDPKTKPKACNYGLAMARGEYLVIYDAEDAPDPLQLKKAFLGFQRAPKDVKCLQAKLNYYNPTHNVLTRLFTAEYSLWFDVILTGLQTVNTYIPLGGTSNHFQTDYLRKLQGWDAFNVTEDCDLGARLFLDGAKTAIIDSVTYEEANSRLINWLRQRSRWIKGYIQTYLVHTRQPIQFFKKNGWHALIFQLVVGGKIAFLFINPVLWLATISYFALNALVGPTIQELYPPFIFYLAVTSLIFGNFLYLYYYMIGAVRRGHWRLVKYVFLVPVYWFFASLAALMALAQLLYKPHHWEKTHHGFHLEKKSARGLRRLVPSFSSLKRVLPKSPDSDKVFSGGTLLIVAMMTANFLNFLFNAFLGRVLSFAELGLVTFVNTLWQVAAVFLGAVGTTVNRRVAFLTTAKSNKEGSGFLYATLKKSLAIALGLSLFWVLLVPTLSDFFNISNFATLFLFTPIFAFGFLLTANRGFLNGTLNFSLVGVLFLVEAVSKLAIAGALVLLGAETYVYLSVPVSIIIAALASTLLIRRKAGPAPKISTQSYAFPLKFYGSAVLAGVAATVFLTVDIILVKHYLSAELAGQYALLSLVGKMVYFLASLPTVFMITLVSRSLGRNEDPKPIFERLFTVSLVLASLAVVALGFFGQHLIPLLLGGRSEVILPYATAYAIAFALFALVHSLVTNHLARKNYLFPVVVFLISMAMAVGVSFFHTGIEPIVRVVLATSIFGFLLVAFLHRFGPSLRILRRNLMDLFSVFQALPFKAADQADSRILIFNWRDTRHVFAGGAEVYIHELARKWVEAGNAVTIFCGSDRKNPANETIDGVNIVRRGGFYTVYLWAVIYYFLHFRGKYDVIIDSENGIPFFAPLYVKEPVFCLMHHIHQEVFRKYLAWPLAVLARFLEKTAMPIVYKNTRFITISESTKQQMQSLGLGVAGIDIVHPGVDLQRLTVGRKSAKPSVLYLGRLKAYKSIDVLINAFKVVADQIKDAELVIAGSGEEEGRLKALAEEMGLSSRVRFAGKVSEKEKVRLMQEAWVFVNPSFMEGWGITTIEAGACGTPIVASDVPGLRDSVHNPHTGYLVRHGDYEAFAEKIMQIINDRNLQQRMGRDGRKWAENFDWSKTSKDFLEIISKECSGGSVKEKANATKGV